MFRGAPAKRVLFMPEVCRNFIPFCACWRFGDPIGAATAGPNFVLASFSLLCTMQYRFCCVLTLVRPRWFKRVRRLLCRMLTNTGSTVPIHWLMHWL